MVDPRLPKRRWPTPVNDDIRSFACQFLAVRTQNASNEAILESIAGCWTLECTFGKGATRSVSHCTKS